jgi:probable rRNA maturation factor
MHEGPFRDLHPRLLGDVVISIETAARDAAKEGVTLEDEILFLMIHGVLHLLGYDHEGTGADGRRMRDQERRVFEAVKNTAGK